jgi:peptidyl-prolyl cis-trans isomerase A (cyclophilin A)
MTVKRKGFLAAAVCLLAAGCSEQKTSQQAAPAKKQSDRAPDSFRAKFETSKGDFIIEVRRDWAPRGADRFYNLLEDGFFDGVRFHRVVRNFIVQFGIHPDPAVSRLWANLVIPDDPPKEKNKKGTIAFAHRGPVTRTTQVFINLKDNSATLDKSGFVPFGKVVEGMEVVESLYSAYGEVPPRGAGPDPVQIEIQGKKYLEAKFPRLDYIRKASILP